jgi:hypothetical protein
LASYLFRISNTFSVVPDSGPSSNVKDTTFSSQFLIPQNVFT